MNKAGANIYHRSIEPGMLFYVPPTYVVGFAALAESTKGCTGMKFSCVPRAALGMMESGLSAINQFKPSANDKNIADVMADVLAVAKAAKD